MPRLSYHSPMLSELDILRDVCARLEKARIEYMLTGSMAMNYYAQPRMTRDIDIVVALEASDAAKLISTFEPDYFVPEEALHSALRERGMFNLLHLDSVVKVDLIVRKQAPYRQTEFGRRVKVQLPGFAAWLVSREDLILSKLAWARDAESELQMRDVRNLLSGEVDLAYLRQWAPSLNVDELLKQCLRERHKP
ncbi:MAG: nucleotidyl transferase AbiEii/AbiGii toxin family protein [Betaproteobacteria bacterium]|nr:nucleotidyl transferase AbiEii/AbiGii toxin family protein [Betaproteobacteria bacterium]